MRTLMVKRRVQTNSFHVFAISCIRGGGGRGGGRISRNNFTIIIKKEKKKNS